ncbi:hypothetical protein E1B28_008100 [Marasmius oreades]|uniref:Uncharacterized protein n=1 Tax=Marasmius oreades TaxID=181124 RepID=A0A9P7URE9_9AGAR|nr:uncharacterized protein E1B28_008100 [Marasmius oreades]KAG7091697.1 hypothetical protein E1B28_008100 [Marasmius oreades]
MEQTQKRPCERLPKLRAVTRKHIALAFIAEDAYFTNHPLYLHLKSKCDTQEKEEYLGRVMWSAFVDLIQELGWNAKMGLVWANQSGIASRAVILAHNATLEDRQLPPPRLVDNMKDVLGTSRDPKWFKLYPLC